MSSPGVEQKSCRIPGLGVVLLLAAVAVLQFHWFATNPWMSLRLAPSWMMARGMPFYPSPSGGPYALTLYGFVAPLFYLPWAWISDADWGLRAAGFWTVLWTMGLGALLIQRQLRAVPGVFGGERRLVIGLFILAAWAIPSMRLSLFEIHADAAAQICVLLACVGVLSHAASGRSWPLILAALAAGTAPWAKQVAIFPALGIIAWLCARSGWKTAFLFSGVATVAGGAWLLLGCAWYGFDVLRFNLLTVPSAQPWLLWSSDKLVPVTAGAQKIKALLVLLGRDLIWQYGPLALLTFGLAFAARKLASPPRSRWLQAHPGSTLFCFIAACAFPSLALGLVKEGAAVNSASFFTCPLLLGAFSAAIELRPALARADLLRPLMWGSVSWVGLLAAVGLSSRVPLVGWAGHAALQRFVHDHPGELYCPFDPLVHVLEDKTCPPVSDVLLSMDLAQRPVTPPQFAAAYHLPRPPRMIVLPHFATGETYIFALFPNYQPQPALPELPGFRVFAPSSEESNGAPRAGH